MDIVKLIGDFFTGKIPAESIHKFLAPFFFVFVVLKFSEIFLGVSLDSLHENMPDIINLGLLITSASFLFTIYPNVYNKIKNAFEMQNKIRNIRKYDQQKKTILLVAFKDSYNHIPAFFKKWIGLAEMIADGVLEEDYGGFHVASDVWKHLNKSPAKRDQLLQYDEYEIELKRVLGFIEKLG